METLQQLAQPIERIINSVAVSLRLEVAVFDNEAQLLCCTPTYQKKKGRIVHAPSIQEVLHYGSSVVNRPGEMAACIGCRFRDNCPATIEILACIKSGGTVYGVVAITSFTREGYARINANLESYLDTVSEISLMLGGFIAGRTLPAAPGRMDDTLHAIMETATHPMLLADANGVITQYNSLAKASLKFCLLSASSLWHIVPEELAKQALQGKTIREKGFVKDGYHASFSSTPIYDGEELTDVVIRLTQDYYGEDRRVFSLEHIIGATPQTRELHRMIAKVADSPSPVLLTGETGTGKELVARAIHEQGGYRRCYPFVAVNCSGIPESLFESELFGYAEGAFTGAKKGGKPGKIEMAQGGTLFLDELGEMPLSLQPKLLRVLQEYELERVGSSEKIPLNIRIIAATNCDLEEMIRQGKFRQDLFYRISVVNIELPPLRERREDILPIAMNYLQKLKLTLRTPVERFSPEVERLFLAYPWPGNVRELQNAVEYAANLCENATVELRDLPKKMLARNGETGPAPRRGGRRAMPADDQKALRQLLERYGQTLEGKKRIAEELGISLRTLYRRLGRMETGKD